MITYICPNCRKEFQRRDCIKNVKFCSKKCFFEGRGNTDHSGCFKKGHEVKKEWKEKTRLNLQKAWDKIRGKTYAEIGRKPYIRSEETKRKNRLTTKKRWEKHWAKHGKKEYRSFVHLDDGVYGRWRKSVFERDKYKCQKCGIVGGRLVAHHIKNWLDAKKERYWKNNGITLCEVHHREFHKMFGRRNNNKRQINKYLKQCLATLK